MEKNVSFGSRHKGFVVKGVLMDLSRVFDCIPNGILLPKLAA